MGVLYSQRVKARALGYLIAGVAAGQPGCIVLVPHAAHGRRDRGADPGARSPCRSALAVAMFGPARGRDAAAGLHGAGHACWWPGPTTSWGPRALPDPLHVDGAVRVRVLPPPRRAPAHGAHRGHLRAGADRPDLVTSPVVRWILGIGTPLVGGLLISQIVRLATRRTEVLAGQRAPGPGDRGERPRRLHHHRRVEHDPGLESRGRADLRLQPRPRRWAGTWPT